MALLFEFGLLIVALGAVFVLLGHVVTTVSNASRMLARLVMLLLRSAAVAGCGGVIVGLIAGRQQGIDAQATGTLAAVLLLPLVVAGFTWWDGRERSRPDVGAVLDRHRAREEKPQPPADLALTAAWEAALALAPREARRLAAARRACGRLLHGADAAPLDMEMMDLAIIIRRHIPDLVAHTGALCATADADEKQALIDEMMQSIEKVAADAERLNERERAGLRHGLRVLHAHIANRTTRRGL